MNETVFTVCVEANNGHGTAMTCTRETLGEALQEAVKQASYYRLSCGYVRPTMTVVELCASCYGSGEPLDGKPGSRGRKCTACRKKSDVRARTIFNDVPFELHENTVSDIDRLLQAADGAAW